ncbi:MAG: hypothetical protein ACR2NZ_08670 [Rubripirellula sp.]
MLTTRQLLRGFGMDRAVFYAMGARIWQIPSGIVTATLIALCLDERQQGIYLLLWWLVGFQALVDAGLLNTLLHAASHEAAKSRFDSRGFIRVSRRSRGRLAGLTRFAIAWFGIAAFLLAVVGGIVGVVLLNRTGVAFHDMGPLFAAMMMAGLALSVSPLIAILEGCNQVQVVNRYRFGQAVMGSLVVWACLMSGAGMWAVAAGITVQLVWELALVASRYRRFFFQLVRTATRDFSWREEVWPLQWRIGVQSIARYVAFLPIYPVLFDTHGPELAGLYGLTWQVMSNMMMVAYAYVRTRSPEFGQLIAEDRRTESNQLFRRATVGSTLLLSAMSLTFCVVLGLLPQLNWEYTTKFASAFLDPIICVWFAVALIPIHLTQCFAMHIRSQKFDPIWRVNLPACLTLTVLAYFAAKSGEVVWIAVAMIVTFTASAVALALMWRWYHRYFERIEGDARLDE